MDLLDPLIQSEIDAGYITRRPHPKYDLFVLPVVNAAGELLGRITLDDVVDFIREEAERD